MSYITPPEHQGSAMTATATATASAATASFAIEPGQLDGGAGEDWWVSPDSNGHDSSEAASTGASQHESGAVQPPDPAATTITTTTTNTTTAAAAQNGKQSSKRRSSAAAGSSKAAVSVACISCRSKHLKCDGGVRCSRCQTYNLTCSYVKSRRGFKGPRRVKAHTAVPAEAAQQNPPPSAMLPSPTPSNQSLPSDSVGTIDLYPSGDAASNTSVPTPDMTVFGQVLAGAADIAPEAASLLQLTPPSHGDRYAPTTVPPNIPKAFAGTLTDLAAFFTYYQPAHPFLPPLPRFQELLATNNLLHVCLAMRYLGSAFIPGMRCQAHEDAVERCLFHQHQSQDGFAVWAMLLYALGLHASANPVRAFQVLQAAIDLALALGMHRRDFATTYGEACPVLEESWRRTFWELYVVDGMFAAVTQRTAFRLHTVVADVPLPCEESEYNSGNIPVLRTLADYDDAIFESDETVFSSYTYRIAAIRNLGKVLPVTDGDSVDHQAIDLADASIVNWSLHLPACKKDPVTRDGHLDEMLFQAHMVCMGSTILLHRPRSYLSCKEVKEVTICVSPDQSLLPSQAYEVHTARAIRAAEHISKLVTLPVALKRHSPFFTCVVTMSSVVHLAYWSFFVADGEDSLVKEQIRLNIGALKTYADLWPVAKCVLGQVRGVAQEMFASKKMESLQYVDFVIGEELLRGMIEEEVANTMAVASSLPVTTM